MKTEFTLLASATATLVFRTSRYAIFPHLNYLQGSVNVLCAAIRALDAVPPVPVKAVVVAPVEIYAPIDDPSPMRVDHPLAVQEINGCKALLLEIIRRAAYDWVLYRTSQRLQYKKLAEDAFFWLFVEEAGHPNWIERSLNQKAITSFLAICEVLDLDPQLVRREVKKLTVKNVMHVGRPAEYRRTDWREGEHTLTTGVDDSQFPSYDEEHVYEET